MYNVHCTVSNVQCLLCSVKCAVFIVQCEVCSVLFEGYQITFHSGILFKGCTFMISNVYRFVWLENMLNNQTRRGSPVGSRPFPSSQNQIKLPPNLKLGYILRIFSEKKVKKSHAISKKISDNVDRVFFLVLFKCSFVTFIAYSIVFGLFLAKPEEK